MKESFIMKNLSSLKTFLSFFIIINLNIIYAQDDTLIFKNKNIIIGDIKKMGQGVLYIETDYSDADFSIEWIDVAEIYSAKDYIISLNNGERIITKLETNPEDKSKLLLDDNGKKIIVSVNDIVYIQPLKKNFIDKLNASLDLGYSLTKANNLRQLSLRSNIGYLTNKWSSDASFDAVNSAQDSIETTQRIDAYIGYNYFIGRRWYALINVGFLQNTEQKLNLRSTPQIGMGNYIIQTNAMYCGIFGGGAWNIENYTDPDEPLKNSMEAYLGSELNLFDIGDLNLLTKISVYKSITESGRWRSDFKFDLKYDLPLDFYIRLGYTYNYDNRPVEGGSTSDYVFQTTFGWEL